MGSLEPRALHASRLLESAHARPKEIYPPKGDLCPVMGSLEPQALLACLLLESKPTGRPFFLLFGCGSLILHSGGYRLIFLDPRALPTWIIGKETVPQGTSGTSSSNCKFAPREHAVATLWPSRLRVGWRLRHTWRSSSSRVRVPRKAL